MQSTLYEVFGYSTFRSSQRGIVNATLAGRDVFVIMPTGGGKSLCYQLPAMITVGVTVVICPLVSLIQDQVDSMIQQGVVAESLSASQTFEEQSHIMRQLRDADALRSEDGIRLLYVTPERLSASSSLTNLLRRLHSFHLLRRFVVDECHCVSVRALPGAPTEPRPWPTGHRLVPDRLRSPLCHGRHACRCVPRRAAALPLAAMGA